MLLRCLLVVVVVICGVLGCPPSFSLWSSSVRLTRVRPHTCSRCPDRQNVEVLDMLQFHWWDYSDENWLAACRHLADLQTDGLIREVALTNFDTEVCSGLGTGIARLGAVSGQPDVVVLHRQHSLSTLRAPKSILAFGRPHDASLRTQGARSHRTRSRSRWSTAAPSTGRWRALPANTGSSSSVTAPYSAAG